MVPEHKLNGARAQYFLILESIVLWHVFLYKEISNQTAGEMKLIIITR